MIEYVFIGRDVWLDVSEVVAIERVPKNISTKRIEQTVLHLRGGSKVSVDTPVESVLAKLNVNSPAEVI